MDKAVRTSYVVSPQYRPKMMNFSVIGGALVFGKFDASIVVNGAGDYTITFNEQFVQIPQVGVLALGATRTIEIATCSKSSVNIKFLTMVPAAANTDFHLFVVGSLAKDLIVNH